MFFNGNVLLFHMPYVATSYVASVKSQRNCKIYKKNPKLFLNSNLHSIHKENIILKTFLLEI